MARGVFAWGHGAFCYRPPAWMKGTRKPPQRWPRGGRLIRSRCGGEHKRGVPVPANRMEPAMPLALTDDQLCAVMNAAQPLLPADPVLFLEDVAAALADVTEIGDGQVARIAREMQRRYFRAPDL